MRFDALLMKINGISEMFLIIDHFEMSIADEAIGSIVMFFLNGLIIDFKLDGIVNWRKPCYSLVARPYSFFLLPKIPNGLVLCVSVG